MDLTNSRVLAKVAILFLAVFMFVPAEAAIARSYNRQQLDQKERSDSSSEKSSESVEFSKHRVTSLVIDNTEDTPATDVDQQLIPDPLPPVFDEELVLSSPRRLDVLREAGSELPWPIGSYNAHIRRVSISDTMDMPRVDLRQHNPIPESPDKRHRYVHSILHGYGNEENVAGAFGA